MTGEGVSRERWRACRRLAEACWAEPMLVAGPRPARQHGHAGPARQGPDQVGRRGRSLRRFSRTRPRLCLKIDDGGKRAAEFVATSLVRRVYPEAEALGPQTLLRNFRGLTVGEIRPSEALERLLASLP